MKWKVENECIRICTIKPDVPKNIGAVGNMLCYFLLIKFE
jgi:hypothetical protein